jgi:phospholipid/cholesterol/gamma-HCH transport system substrate-binding protein
MFGTGKKITKDIDAIVDGVRKGRGVAGKLFTDDRLYARVQNTVQKVESVATNFDQTSQDARKIVADIQSRKLGETLQKTAVNVEQATGHVKEVLATLKPQPDSEQRGLIDDVREAMDNTREATADLAENMEALKRNWFFRGFFNRRGFFDLDAVSIQEYREGKIAPERPRERKWLHGRDLFTTDAAGKEVLSAEGRRAIDEAMVPYLRYAPNTLLIVEGYAAQGNEQEHFLHSRDRGLLVRRYLIDRFGVKGTYVGAIPMGAVATSPPSGEFWEGVCLVFFPEKPKK